MSSRDDYVRRNYRVRLRRRTPEARATCLRHLLEAILLRGPPAPSAQPYTNADYEPSDAEVEQANRESWERVTGQQWSCFYDPTMNNDWHDDVLCTDGPTSHRPVLLADWNFVTENDMRAAAQDHENYLNAGAP